MGAWVRCTIEDCACRSRRAEPVPRPPLGADSSAPRRPGSFSALPSAGDTLGDFDLLATVGSRITGCLFEAFDRARGRRVLLKIGWPHRERDELRAEARTLARVQHPGIVKLLATGRHGDLEYLVLDDVPGHDLDTYLDVFGRLPTLRALTLLAELADSLAALHGIGVAHRDLSPRHVVLTHDGRAVLTDIGLALPDVDGCTRSVGGSPHYLAPEVIEGRVEPGKGHLVDVYAFGILAYELLAGTVPFPELVTLRVLHRHVAEPIPPIGPRCPELDPDVVALVHALLAKAPEARPRSMRSVAECLRGLVGSRA